MSSPSTPRRHSQDEAADLPEVQTPLLPGGTALAQTPAAQIDLTENEARFTLATLTKVCGLVAIAQPSSTEVILFVALLVCIVIYLVLGYQVILAPGRVYNTLIASNWPAFHAELRFFSLLLVVITSFRVGRGLLTDALANILRRRLALQVHARYLETGDSLLNVTKCDTIDNPDQRAVADTRDFCDSLIAIVAGQPSEASAGALEAALSVGWYSLAVVQSAGLRGVLLAYAWSALASALGAVAVSFAARARATSEAYEARLRYSHAALRADASAVAFEGAHQWRRHVLDTAMLDAVKARWGVVRAKIPIGAVDHGFAYCVSIVMYGAIAVASATGSSFRDLSAGEKAQWVSQTGGVFLQLLYAFTMVVSLAPRLSAFVAQTHRVHGLLMVVQPTSVAVNDMMLSGDNKQNGVDDKIECRALRVALPDKHRITAPVTLRVQAGQRVLLTGPSGVGKTSTLFALRGLIQPHSGTIMSIPTDTAFVAQGARLAPGMRSLRECIVCPALIKGDIVEGAKVCEALTAVGWTRNDSIDDIREWATILSPGECQLIAVAGILVREPRFAVLDEPTSALDTEAEANCFRALTQSKVALLTVAHSDAVKRLHDTVINMETPNNLRGGP